MEGGGEVLAAPLPRMQKRCVGQSGAGRRPVLVPDTAINTLPLLERLQEKADRPVITANQATLWHALAKVGYSAAAAKLARPW